MSSRKLIKTILSILAAIVFVGLAFIAFMLFAKPILGEEPWNNEETVQTDEIKLEKVKTMYVTAEEGLSMSSEPGEDEEAIHLLSYGQEVRVLKTENGWANIKADGLTGWCPAGDLTEDQSQITQKESGEVADDDKSKLVEPSNRIKNGSHWVVNTEGGLNFRCGPGQDYDILMVIPYEDEVVEEGREGDWVFVSYDGQYGWVSSEYISPMKVD